MTFAYLAYKMLCMRDVHQYFNRLDIKPITMINVAVNASQALDNFFDPFTKLLRRAGPKAFKAFGFNPDDHIRADYVIFPNNVQVVSGHSKAGSQEGYDILVGLVDECDDADFNSIDKLVSTLVTSSNSRFFGREKIINISYSRYYGSNGKIQSLYEQYKDSDYAFVMKCKPWDFNPRPEYTEEYFVKKFKTTNPEEFKFMYECDVTSGNMEAFIKDSQRIKNAMSDRKWILGLPLPSEKFESDSFAEVYIQNPDPDNLYSIDPYNIPIIPNPIEKRDIDYFFVGDPGAGNVDSQRKTGGDAYGICLAHRETIVRENGLTYPRVVIDFAFRFTGRMFPENQIQMIAIEVLIDRLIQNGYNIKVFSFDGWNSLATVQNLRRKYPNAMVFQRNIVEFKHYSKLRDLIFGEAPPSNGNTEYLEVNGGIDFPYHPIVFWELKNLIEDRERKKVDHKSTTTKDISDTIAMAAYLLTDGYPMQEMAVVGGNPLLDLEAKINKNKASDQEKENYKRKLLSNSIGLGGFKKG